MESLCQDCLRSNPVHVSNFGVCLYCSGDTCSCRSCLSVLSLLRSGERRAVYLGIRFDLLDWTESEGAVITASG